MMREKLKPSPGAALGPPYGPYPMARQTLKPGDDSQANDPSLALPLTDDMPAYPYRNAPIINADESTGEIWRVARVMSRQEKGFVKALQQRGVIYFLPARYHLVTHARKKTVSAQPLFNGYAFFYGGSQSVYDARATRRMVSLIPASHVHQQTLRDELECLRKAMLEDPCLQLPVAHNTIAAGTKVIIIAGGMEGQTAVVHEDFPDYVFIPITVMGQAVAVKMPKDNIRVLPGK